MSILLIYPVKGRGSFATNAQLGGTLHVSGTGAGCYYRAPATSATRMPGRTGAIAVRAGTTCSINDYAVWSAIKALQRAFGAAADGIFGGDTGTAAKSFQKANGLIADGIVGPSTCRAILEPLVVSQAHSQDGVHADMLAKITLGTMSVESGFDLGAVGVETPVDVGVAQINGPAHPSMSVDARLDPAIAIAWMCSFIDGNLKAFDFNVDVAIAAYNLGPGGAASWQRAGKPQSFHGADVWLYIKRIRAAGGLQPA